MRIYIRLAKKKILDMSDLIVIAITGSYGKTSIKNIIYQIIKYDFKAYATPRSVNTNKGLAIDINASLPSDTQVYIAEAGARNKGDIAEISNLLNQHYAVIGKIGNAHIEYFKNIQNTIQTKFEILCSPRLKKLFLQKDNKLPDQIDIAKYNSNISQSKNLILYPFQIRNEEANLSGISFEMLIDSNWCYFSTTLLGRFNIDNIAVAILLALELGIPLGKIQEYVKNLEPIPHRLFKMITPHKIILDDSFNGNLEGMTEAIRLASLHEGRKIIVTPGLVEYDEESNIKLCEKIDDVFDLAIITSSLNARLFNSHISRAEKIFIEDKSVLEDTLAQTGKNGDLVLFANDAPNYI
ncbi:Mur ligase family protein [Helicobacter muridarum]|uniref:Mur ligase family protein n=1 Tax=Helicobacter muridarum TaxID=216 RepID=UPI001F41EDDB|nr:UDP-N-acetylmuramoyl-tripeptide--D-alanyl-D-alanine ligase [Helicobacter muridarum]